MASGKVHVSLNEDSGSPHLPITIGTYPASIHDEGLVDLTLNEALDLIRELTIRVNEVLKRDGQSES